jgi:hypothetical protein
MITGLVIMAVASLVGLAGGLLPQADPVQITGPVMSGMASLARFAAGFGSWLPFSAAAQAAALLAALLLIGWGIHLVRMALSFVTGGGGNA